MSELNKEKEIVLIGYSGHSFEIIDIIISLGYKIKGYSEISEKKNNPYGIKYLGDENKVNFKYLDNRYLFFIALGNNLIRNKKSDLLDLIGLEQINVIHPDSSISERIKIGYGNFISRNSSINNAVEIGNSVIINTAAVIEHECKIESVAHIGPGVVLCGGVTVKKGAFIGANSVIKENLCIGKNVVIGAGSVVLQNISDNSLAFGNPSRIKK